MKNYRKKITAGISEKTGLPIDTLCGMPYIQISSDRELVIEGNCRLRDYSDGSISVTCSGTKIRICGSGLCLRLMNDDAFIICGKITSLSFGE